MKEKLYRIAAVGGLVVGSLGVGGYFYERHERQEQYDALQTQLEEYQESINSLEARGTNIRENQAYLKQEIENLTEQQRLNLIGDCANENVLRMLLGYPRATLEECYRERKMTPIPQRPKTPPQNGNKEVSGDV